jgi:hypothetical protein
MAWTDDIQQALTLVEAPTRFDPEERLTRIVRG